ncbi:hypothetical protein G9U51_16425 [Calidifontibacter sp. DB0510]|uniref:C4-type zinc ribbon domain-containing protein n=1 Tax=Metallococcus carri TaxID=1656884 RepID=A0A967B858_9MICO|nr:C4-type zinc ribbon domain-containing protein [Metallococcus carri]NHN57357.1 hypothetical protein [Metallococcus carri]NOP39135.1 hypothetical protein [Calidifontibacter sp. DB2511S]
MKADPSKQLRLLDLQALDTKLAQVAHKRRTLPVLAQLEAATARQTTLEEDVVLARTAVADVEREITKAEADVQQVRDREDRDRARLDAGTGTAKELQSLQHELETLQRRQSELEDIELEVMERAESLRSDLAAREKAATAAAAKVEQLTTDRDTQLAELDTEQQRVSAERNQVAPGLGQELLAFYEKLREQLGTAAAALQARRCGGCGLELDAAELARVKAAPEDEVLRHEECRRIIVRTPESGL